MKLAIADRRRWLAGLCLLCSGLLLSGMPFIQAEEPAEKKSDAKPAEKADQGWKSLFDGESLGGWEETNFGTEGGVSVADGKLNLSFGEGCTGINWKKEFPKVDYEVRLQAQRVEGSDFFCGMIFPVQETHCSFVVGGWGGAVVGLSAVDGAYADSNPTTKFMTFKKGQWYDIRLRVTKTCVSAWIDDKPVVDLETTGHKLTLHPAVAKAKPFGLCSWMTTAALRKIELRTLTAEEAQPVKTTDKAEPKSDK